MVGEQSGWEDIGRRIRAAMDVKRMTANDLISEVNKVDPGLKWTAAIVANLTAGRRRYVTVEELFTLALVLDIAPVDLLVPPDADDDAPYTVTPTVTATAGQVRDWIAGIGFLGQPDTARVARALGTMPASRVPLVSARWLQAANRELHDG